MSDPSQRLGPDSKRESTHFVSPWSAKYVLGRVVGQPSAQLYVMIDVCEGKTHLKSHTLVWVVVLTLCVSHLRDPLFRSTGVSGRGR